MAEPSVVPAPELGVLPAGTIVANNYRVLSRLGAGGMGTVYLGENITLAQQVVIKVLRVGGRGAGAEEARLLASLDHPNVVHVYAYDEKWDCIVMQHLKGSSLQSMLEEQEGRLDLIIGLRVAAATAQALSAVHERGVVHRDVKPDNVMLELSGGEVKWVKLIDLGTALRVNRTIEQPAGTPEFCGPEQFDGSIGASPGNDVYALGVTIFLLCARIYPYDAEPYELARLHRDAPIPDLLEAVEQVRQRAGMAALEPQLHFVIEQVSELVARMMAKEARARPSAREVAYALSELVDRFSSQNTQVGRAPAPLLLTQVSSAAKVSTMVLPRAKAQSTTDQLVAAGLEPKKSSSVRWIALAALLLLFVGGVGLWMGRSGSDATVQPVTIDAGAGVVEAPVLDAGVAVAVVEPVAAIVDAGEELAPLVGITPNKVTPRGKPDAGKLKVLITNPDACSFDDRFRTYARNRRREVNEEFTDGGKTRSMAYVVAAEQMDAAMAAKDCVKANAALRVMEHEAGVGD